MLLNILIAIVWTAYSNVQNVKLAKIVFWEIRLGFATQVIFFSGQKLWEYLVNRYDSTLDPQVDRKKKKKEKFQCERRLEVYYKLLFFRIISSIFIVIWLLLGAVTAGLLWPPQVREWLWYKIGFLLPDQVGEWFCDTGWLWNTSTGENMQTSPWSYLTKIYEDKSKDKYFASGVFRWVLLPLCRLIYPVMAVTWVLIGFITAGILLPPQVRKWFWGESPREASKETVSATEQSIQDMDKIITNLNEIIDRDMADIEENRRVLIRKINEMIGRATTLLDVVCNGND